MDGTRRGVEQIIEINGLPLHYFQAGSGYPVLLLHGWGVDSSTFCHVENHLADSFTTYSLDMPGFGETPPPKEAWSIYDYADLVETFLATQALDAPILIGHSFGGRISIILGSRGLAKKIVLADSAGILPHRGLDYYAKVYSYKLGRKLLGEGWAEKRRQKTGSADYQAASGVMRQTFVKVVNEDLQPLLAKIQAPTLLVWGSEDTATPLRDAKIMEQQIADCGLVVFEGCGHYAFLEQAVRFNLILDAFFAAEKEGIKGE